MCSRVGQAEELILIPSWRTVEHHFCGGPGGVNSRTAVLLRFPSNTEEVLMKILQHIIRRFEIPKSDFSVLDAILSKANLYGKGARLDRKSVV